MEVPLSTDICRCCLSPGNYKSLKETFQWMGENENYGDMLKECFDVTLCDTDNDCHGGICELCITQLRNARNFKKQVLKSDEIFKRGLDSHFKGGEVKIEFINENYLDSDIGNQDDYFAGLETEEEADIPIKEEVTVVETKNRKRAVKQPVKEETATKKKKPEANTSDKGEPKRVERQRTSNSDRRKIIEEKTRRRHRLMTILEQSNATPFKSKTGKGFNCVYCSEIISDPADLKTHVLKDHGDVKIEFTYLNEMLSLEKVKLDVTDLECSVCCTRLSDLTDLCNHLNERHDKQLYIHSRDKFFPFIFADSKDMKCIFCPEVFLSFQMLIRHMNIHYRNYICKECATGFATKGSIRTHVRESHRRGTYSCGVCEKVFTSLAKMKDHEKSVHFGFKRNKCPHCPERFVSYDKRNAHVAEEHGAPVIVYECNGCERSFNTQKKLGQHIRKDHLLERSHACAECDKRFFKKTALMHHMLTHTKKRQFKCDVCLKSYGRKTTLREHMRIHNNDRRFKCEKCLQSFVQKCSWRSHMRNRHNLIVL